MVKDRKIVAVVAIETIFGPNPQIANLILNY